MDRGTWWLCPQGHKELDTAKQQDAHAQRDQKDTTRPGSIETEGMCAPQIQRNMYVIFFGKDIKECEVNQINA